MAHRPPSPSRPLSIDTMINAIVMLYRTQWRSYFSLSFQASVWMLIPLVVGAFGLMAALATEAPELWLGGVPFLLGGAVYCWARSLIATATITRLAVEALQDRPESLPTAYRWARSRLWSLLGASLLLGLIFILAYVGLSLVVGMGIGAIALLFGISLPNISDWITRTPLTPDFAILIILGILGGSLLFLLVVISVFVWLGTRFFLYDVPLMAEAHSNPLHTLRTSWQLTHGHTIRVMLVLLGAVLITAPLFATAQGVSGVFQWFLMLWVDPMNPVFTVLIVLFGGSVGAIANLILIPFWQVLKSVVYHDLNTHRDRRAGDRPSNFSG